MVSEGLYARLLNMVACDQSQHHLRDLGRWGSGHAILPFRRESGQPLLHQNRRFPLHFPISKPGLGNRYDVLDIMR